MRKERGEECDTTTHLIKFQVFTHTSRVTYLSTDIPYSSTSATCVLRLAFFYQKQGQHESGFFSFGVETNCNISSGSLVL